MKLTPYVTLMLCIHIGFSKDAYTKYFVTYHTRQFKNIPAQLINGIKFIIERERGKEDSKDFSIVAVKINLIGLLTKNKGGRREGRGVRKRESLREIKI